MKRAVITVFFVILIGISFYSCKSIDATMYYSGKNLQPENYKLFWGSWIFENRDGEQERGFTLHVDGSASSINTQTLLYRKWKIENSDLVLTAISLGNHTASVFEERYTIKSFNNQKIFLEMNGNEYVYTKSDEAFDDTEVKNTASLSTSFEYFPVDDIAMENSVKQKHPIDFSSNVEAGKLKTDILYAYESNDVNFAGYYVAVTWSCGTSCLDGVIIDVRDGKIYDLPSKEGFFDIGNGFDSRLDSILFVTSFTLSIISPQGEHINEVDTYYWLWDEQAKEFIRYMGTSP